MPPPYLTSTHNGPCGSHMCKVAIFKNESFVYSLARLLCLNNCGNNTIQLYLEIIFGLCVGCIESPPPIKTPWVFILETRSL